MENSLTLANAQHIFDWARNSAEHDERLRALSKFPRGGNFTITAAGYAFQLASSTYRAMRTDRGGENYSSEDILRASIMFLEYQPEIFEGEENVPVRS